MKFKSQEAEQKYNEEKRIKVQCDDCMMYDPYECYCRWFQMHIDDFNYECTIELPSKKSRKNEEE